MFFLRIKKIKSKICDCENVTIIRRQKNKSDKHLRNEGVYRTTQNSLCNIICHLGMSYSLHESFILHDEFGIHDRRKKVWTPRQKEETIQRTTLKFKKWWNFRCWKYDMSCEKTKIMIWVEKTKDLIQTHILVHWWIANDTTIHTPPPMVSP